MMILADQTMYWHRLLVPLAVATAVFVVTIEMIRRRRLREEYAMLWLGASAVMLIFAIFPRLLAWVARLLDVNYLTIVVLALFFFLAMIVMHFAMVISRQSEEIRQLAQQYALLQRKLEPPAGTPRQPATEHTEVSGK